MDTLWTLLLGAAAVLVLIGMIVFLRRRRTTSDPSQTHNSQAAYEAALQGPAHEVAAITIDDVSLFILSLPDILDTAEAELDAAVSSCGRAEQDSFWERISGALAGLAVLAHNTQKFGEFTQRFDEAINGVAGADGLRAVYPYTFDVRLLVPAGESLQTRIVQAHQQAMSTPELASGWAELSELKPLIDEEWSYKDVLDHGAGILEQTASQVAEIVRRRRPANAGIPPQNMMNAPEFKAVVDRLRRY